MRNEKSASPECDKMPRHRKPLHRFADDAFICAHYNKDMTARQIAKYLDLPRGTVITSAQRLGLCREKGRRVITPYNPNFDPDARRPTSLPKVSLDRPSDDKIEPELRHLL